MKSAAAAAYLVTVEDANEAASKSTIAVDTLIKTMSRMTNEKDNDSTNTQVINTLMQHQQDC